MKSLTLYICVILAGAVFFAGGCTSEKGTTTSPLLLTRDDAPPLPPVGLEAPYGKIAPDAFLLTWSPSSEPDVAGYRVYVFQPSPERVESYVAFNTQRSLAVSTRYICHWDMRAGAWVRVSAVDAMGNESALSAPIYVQMHQEVTPGAPGNEPGDDTGRGVGQVPAGGPGVHAEDAYPE